MIGGHVLWSHLPFDAVFAAPFLLVYMFGLYLQFYVERMERRRWHSERGYQAEVLAESKARANIETMLRFVSHEGINIHL